MTPNKEDYLKCIHELGEKNNKISNKKIAEMMQVSAPAVSEMIKKMISEQLIVKDKDLGYYLTKQGLLVVSDLYRKHRLVEVFLVNHLHYTADDIHEEAEVLEHTVSTTFVDRLEKFLVEINQMTLDQISQLGTYVISRVHDDFQLLKYLEQHRLHINDTIVLTQIDPYAKTYHITYNDENLTIPERIASQIYVSAT